VNPNFGVDTAPAPEVIEDLLDPALRAALERLEITSRRHLTGKLHGERRSRRRGSSIDFADHRPYVAGDDLRFVDWNVYARLDALFLKLYLDEEDLGVLLVLDSTESMDWGAPSKWHYARRLAMALGSLALSSRHRLSMISHGGRAPASRWDLRGRQSVAELGQWLLKCSPGGGSSASLEGTIDSAAAARRGRGVTIMLSDFLGTQDPLAALGRVTAGGHDLHLIQTLSPQEMDPGEAGMIGDLRLVDSETGDTRDVTVTDRLLEAYREKLDARIRLVADAAKRSGGTHVAVSTVTPIENLLLRQLRVGGLVR